MNPRSALLVVLLGAGYMYRQQTPATRVPSNERARTFAAGSSTVTYGQQLEMKDWPLETLQQSISNGSHDAKQVEFLIATVPDPNSHYPVMFDRWLESIKRAAEDSGYTFDHHWLPWQADPGPPDADWVKREQHQDWIARKQQYPGILVFRGPKVLGVLLIGESPTMGIDKEQFANAMKLIGKINGKATNVPVPVLGPTFSGSVPSLGSALGDPSSGASVTKYRVITGSATGVDNKQKLEIYGCPACTPEQMEHGRITYEAAIEDDSVAFSSFMAYLDPDFRDPGVKGLRHEVELNSVAILAEAGSEYSAQFRTQVAKEIKKKAGEAPPAALQPLILEYPMDIARLRNAYEQDPELSVLGAGGKVGDLPRQGLQIRLKDAHEDPGSIPMFSPELSPVSQDAVLSNTFATISRERIRYVGIVASDILDSIFLGRLLKQHCPDVRLFIFDSDLVYGHVAQNYAFQGMMMITSYPLFTANQRWTDSWKGTRRIRQFPSATAQGVYNACRMLLGSDKAQPLIEYAGSDAKSKSEPFRRPTLWLTVVGRDGVWPLTPLSIAPDVKLNGSKLPLLDNPSRGWMLCFWLMTAFCALFSAGVLWANREPGDAKIGIRGVLSMLQIGSDQYSALVRTCLSGASIVLLIVYGFTAAVEISHYSLNAQFSRGALFHIVFCILIPAALLTAVFECWRPFERRLLFVAASVCLGLSFLFFLKYPLSLWFVYRVVHVGNGVTPFVPTVLLSAALVWYAGVHLNRIRFCRARAAELPSFEKDIYLGGVGEAYTGVVRALENVFVSRWPLIALVLLACLLLLNPFRVDSLERFPFEWPYAAGLCILFAALLFEGARFLYTWFALRNMLRMLERHPIQAAFRRLPKELSPTAVWRSSASRRTCLTLAPSIERLRQIVDRRGNRAFPDGAPFEYKAQLDIVEQNTRDLIAAEAAGRPIERIKLANLQSALICVSDRLIIDVLAPAWSKGSIEEAEPAAAAAAAGADSVTSVAIQTPAAPAPTNVALAEEFVALRFAALFRYVTLHLRNLLEFTAGALILAIVSLNSYPFEPHHSIMTTITTCFFVMSALFLAAIVQMNRNTIFSYLSTTTPGKLDSNLLHVVSFGALPLLTVLASQFPSIGGFLFSWVKPALESLR
jgi:hypothetical protein